MTRCGMGKERKTHTVNKIMIIPYSCRKHIANSGAARSRVFVSRKSVVRNNSSDERETNGEETESLRPISRHGGLSYYTHSCTTATTIVKRSIDASLIHTLVISRLIQNTISPNLSLLRVKLCFAVGLTPCVTKTHTHILLRNRI